MRAEGDMLRPPGQTFNRWHYDQWQGKAQLRESLVVWGGAQEPHVGVRTGRGPPSHLRSCLHLILSVLQGGSDREQSDFRKCEKAKNTSIAVASSV